MAVITRFDADMSRSILRPALTMACAVVMTVAVSGKVFAQEDDDSPEPTVMDSIMKGIGAKTMENSGINYRERSPLVIPPTTALPPPEDRAKVAVAPNWPKDPDVIKNKQAIAARKKSASRSSFNDTDGFPLSQSELNNGMAPRKTRQTESDAPGEPADGSFPLSPSQLGYNGGLFSKLMPAKKEEQTFTGEPDRESLVQPPVGYQTPSSNYGYGVDPNTKSSIAQPTEAEKRIYNGAPN